MSQHKQFTIDTGIQVYFAHPGSPWERGANENTNGLNRQYFPKGTEFDKVIKRVQRELNDRPRAVLLYKKPDELINQLVALNPSLKTLLLSKNPNVISGQTAARRSSVLTTTPSLEMS